MDVEVGRYALRTFSVDRALWVLRSVSMSATWIDGTCEAVCLAKNACGGPSPNERCRCGVYGATSLDSLMAQYRAWAKTSVAVIAAEGQTIIGDRGLRTSAARVVAYWCDPSADEGVGEVYAQVCPQARRFGDLESMVNAYGMPCEHPRRLTLGMARVYAEDCPQAVAAQVLVCQGCGQESVESPVIVQMVDGKHVLPTRAELRAAAEATGYPASAVAVTAVKSMQDQIDQIMKMVCHKLFTAEGSSVGLFQQQPSTFKGRRA